LILYNIFMIYYFIISKLNHKDLWDSFLLLWCFTDVIWNLMQSVKSLICVLKTQVTVHLVQSEILKEEIHTFLHSVIIIKSQHSAVVSTVVKRVVVHIFKFIVQFKNNFICLTIECHVRTSNCVNTTIYDFLKCLHSNKWWDRQ